MLKIRKQGRWLLTSLCIEEANLLLLILTLKHLDSKQWRNKSILFVQQAKSKGSILETNSKNSINVESNQIPSSKRDTIYSKKNEKSSKRKKSRRVESHGNIGDITQVPSLFFAQTKDSKNSDRYAASAVPQPRVDSNFSIKLNDLDEISSIESDLIESYE